LRCNLRELLTQDASAGAQVERPDEASLPQGPGDANPATACRNWERPNRAS
jgi:hypothetical protein